MSNSRLIPPANPFRFSVAWLLAYVMVMAVMCAGLAAGRRQLLLTYGSKEAQAEWDQWRFDVVVEDHYGNAPVKRRFPSSPEPPALVLMRDHFAACLGLSLLLSTVLFGTFMIFLRGALSDASQKRARDDASHRRGTENASAKRR